MTFINRDEGLSALESWWAKPGSLLALLWGGRRRAGKTALLQQFSQDRRVVFHTGRVCAHVEAVVTERIEPLCGGIVGEIPLYLEWWDQSKNIRQEKLHQTGGTAERQMTKRHEALTL
ncbi:MAG: hypothetical protein ACRD1T_05770 [Acidimicrobiia bacterium]